VAHALEQRLGVGTLDHLAGVHHGDVVGPVRHHAEVVGDEHHPHVPVALLGLEQVEDLLLDGHVQGRGRLVRDQQARAARQGDRRGHPLAHATRELVRVLRQPPLGRREADRAEQRHRRLLRLRLVEVEVVAERLGDLRPIFTTGLSEVMGSWKTIAISGPRCCASPCADLRRSVPSKMIWPPGGDRRPLRAGGS
jgi:hypothetical protein